MRTTKRSKMAAICTTSVTVKIEPASNMGGEIICLVKKRWEKQQTTFSPIYLKDPSTWAITKRQNNSNKKNILIFYKHKIVKPS